MTNIDDAIERAERGPGSGHRSDAEEYPGGMSWQIVGWADTAAILAAEVKRLREELDRAHEELRQGWPKMARDANRSAIEQWNRADAAEAEVKRLRAKYEPEVCPHCLNDPPAHHVCPRCLRRSAP